MLVEGDKKERSCAGKEAVILCGKSEHLQSLSNGGLIIEEKSVAEGKSACGCETEAIMNLANHTLSCAFQPLKPMVRHTASKQRHRLSWLDFHEIRSCMSACM